MSTAIAIPEAIPADNKDLRGKAIPEVLNEARQFRGAGCAMLVEAVRRVLHIIEGDTWRDPLKYGRQHDDPRFGYQVIGELSANDLCWTVLGMSLTNARRLDDFRRSIEAAQFDCFTTEAALVLAPYPEALQRAVRAISDGKIIGSQEAREFVRPYAGRSSRRILIPVDEDERKAMERQVSQLQKRSRDLEKENARIKAEWKQAKDELRNAREEIADLQKRLYTK